MRLASSFEMRVSNVVVPEPFETIHTEVTAAVVILIHRMVNLICLSFENGDMERTLWKSSQAGSESEPVQKSIYIRWTRHSDKPRRWSMLTTLWQLAPESATSPKTFSILHCERLRAIKSAWVHFPTYTRFASPALHEMLSTHLAL